MRRAMMASAGSLAVARRNRTILSTPWLLLAGGLSAIGALLIALLPNDVRGDTWIALMAGREVAQHGIPHHETLTTVAHGRPWLDQQWLAQLGLYELERLGGLALIGLIDVALVLGSLLGGVWAALRLGARLRSVAWILPLAAWGMVSGLEVRTQAFVYPLMVTLVYLLAGDARRPSRRVWWCLPIVVLWGNLHGSALMAAGLVALRGLTVAWERRGELTRTPRAWVKPLGLVLGAPACLIANPYGLSSTSYYRATVFNPAFHKLIAEWEPVTHEVAMLIAVLLLSAVAIWGVVRHRDHTALWERCALAVLAVGAFVAVRNVPWFALAALVLLPVWIDPSAPAPAWRTRWGPVLAVGVAALGAVWLVQGAVKTLGTSGASLTPYFPAGALEAVRSEVDAHPGWRVYADDTLADWLLWELPELHGRVAADARFELMSSAQLDSEVDLVSAAGAGWKRAARGCRLIVLNDVSYRQATTGFEREPGARTLYRSGHAVVIVRMAAGAAV
jgi:hypothetical protein